MTSERASDGDWLLWIEVQKRATDEWSTGGIPAAVGIVDGFLSSQLPRDLKREALAFRAMLYEEQGDLTSAKADFLSAVALADEGHVRCELEDSLGLISQRLGELEDAGRWFSSALRTAASDPRVAGGGPLLRLLKVRSEKELTEEEQRLAERVIRQTWRLLRIEGEPDLGDLEGTAQKLIEAQGGPFSAERPPRVFR